MASVLEGIRVVEWTAWHQGPIAGAMLGDLGAEVIKIEDRVTGDPCRGFMRGVGAGTGIKGRNFYFEMLNRNKRGITIDLNKPKGKEIAHELVKKSDVFLHNHRLGAPEKMGLDYATLSRINPRLIYASASGWGPKGPMRERSSLDFTGQARSGLMNIGGELGSGPSPLQGAIGDQVGGIMTAYGVVAALFARERLGIGQEIDSSLLGSAIFLMSQSVSFKLAMDFEVPKHNRNASWNVLWNCYKSSDDKYLVLAELQSDRVWPIYCRVLNIPELASDPRFNNMENRAMNAAELVSILDKIFATRTRDEWLTILEKEDNLVFSPVQTFSEVVEDPQVIANEYIADFDHPVIGKYKVIGQPVKFSKTPGKITREAPEFGQHTEEILTEVLGYTWDDITKLKDDEVI